MLMVLMLSTYLPGVIITLFKEAEDLSGAEQTLQVDL
jgi:hypothetical protein